jgi:transposase
MDIEAKKVAQLTKISRVTINKIFNRIRIVIAAWCDSENPLGDGEIELDESYFGPRRQHGKRGRGAGNKIPVFGMLKRNGKVFTQIVRNCSLYELLPIIKQHASTASTIYTDCFRSYDGLADLGYKKHYRIKHGENEFAKGKNHINGIENFWGLCKVRLSRFRGIHKHKFYLHLKECEFRFNNRKNLYICLLNIIKNNPLNLS